ncbi:TIM11 [[Candida] subhashii]|uniref:ATP synthase F(0) complex subunit e, mitochondrial n=1 Tax=[Candida] subhashii TaxID=561895 RepID=A0A8J5UT64_9ASCO|nr:TIM11 [[Candida] subhashii]KAG7665567.1 TIM11 [[Candida] subhashii]
MSTFNVIRWSFLGAGVVYGALHRQTLKSAAEEKSVASKFAQQQKLIDEAKAEYARLNPPKAATPVASGSINWEDPNLDIGKALESLIEKL